MFSHKTLLLLRSQEDFVIFGWIYQSVNYYPAIIRKEKGNNVNREDQKGHCFVLIIGKHPVLKQRRNTFETKAILNQILKDCP